MTTAIDTAHILKAILDYTTDSIVLIDKDHKVITYNSAIKQTLNLIHKKEIKPGCDFRDFVADYHKEKYLAAFEKALSGETIIVESETKTAHVSIWFQFKFNPVYDNANNLLGIAMSATNIDEQKRKEIALQVAKHQLGERVKELSTIYQLHKIMQDEEQSIEEVFTRIVNILPPGWQYPEICAGKIEFDGITITTDNYRQSPYNQMAKLLTADGRTGTIEVVYLQESPKEAEGPFLKEERDLINTLAETIQVYFNKKSHQDGLARSESLFRDLVEKSLVGVYIVQNGRFVYVNPRIAQESGYTDAELTSMPIEQFLHDDDIATVQQHMQARLKGETDAIRYEVRAKTKSGQEMWLEMFGTTTMYQGNMAIIGTMVNVTEKKAVYHDLIKSEANLKSIFDNTQVGYLLLDNQFTVAAYNQYFKKSYAEQTGYELQQGANFMELAIPERRSSIKQILDRVMTTVSPVEYEIQYTNLNAATYYHVLVTPIISEGEVIGFCFGGIDITNRKNMETERQRMLSDLITRNKDLHEFAQIVSHNIRGPLATMLGLNNMLKDSLSNTEKDFILESIGNSAQKLDAVVREMNNLLYVKSEVSEPRVSTNLAALIEDVKMDFTNTIVSTGAIVKCKFDKAPEVVVIRSFLHNILYNLLSNSLKYRQKDKAPHIKITSAKTIQGIEIHFEDNGIGIDMKKHGEQMFGLNKRFHNTADGKGLGLFIVKAQVDALDGTIKVKSSLGAGTAFTITLPA